MTDRELLQQALDALEKHVLEYETTEALRARLAQHEPEPVAWVAYENGEKHGIDFDEDEIAELPVGTMLYTAPPQREWQGLTDEEILEEYRQSYGDDGNLTDVYFAHAIEAKLKEKNSG